MKQLKTFFLMTELLLSNFVFGSDEGLSLVDYELIEAATKGDEKSIREALAAGAYIDAQDYCMRTALHWVTFRGSYSCVKLLLEEGATSTLKDNSHRIPLHWAARKSHHECMKLLLKYTPDLNTPGSFDNLPLHEAVEESSSACLQTLLESGADFFAKNRHGLTAIELAIRKEKRGMTKILKKWIRDLRKREKAKEKQRQEELKKQTKEKIRELRGTRKKTVKVDCSCFF